MFETSRRVALGVVLAVPVVGTAAATTAEAAPPPAPARQHCVTRKLPPDQFHAGVPSHIECFDTFEAAMGSVGVHVSAGVAATPAALGASATATATVSEPSFAETVLAWHYEGFGATGDGFYVTGTNCDGGGLNLNNTPWNDRIRSTENGACSRVKHFTDINFQGAMAATTPGNRNLPDGVAGQVSSISYTSG